MYYINRELSWLKFNKRVLLQADAPEVPLFERMKFIAIFESNLDEFFMVRAGSMHDRALISAEMRDDKTKMTAREQLDAIYRDAKPLCELCEGIFERLEKQLADKGIIRENARTISDAEAKTMKSYFKHEILPLLSPQIIDAKHPFPHLENKKLYVISELERNGKTYYGIIPILQSFERMYFSPSDDTDEIRYILIEDILMRYLKDIFKIYNVKSRAVIRVTRNADIEVADNFSDDSIDYRSYVDVIIKKRGKLSPIRLECYSGAYGRSKKLISYFMHKIGLSEPQCFWLHKPCDPSYIYALERKLPKETELLYSPLVPQNYPDISARSRITEIAYERDILLSFPYHTMRPYLKLLEEAATDDDTVSIKITLYRLSSTSEVIRLLCLAAENGKEVTAVVELKARFDESNNIGWSKRLEDSGCNIVYGVDGLKTHSKITLITRKNDDGVSCITHIGTGNYNEKTARLYTDVGIITSDSRICSDAVDFFRNITLGVNADDYKTLLVAPNCMKNKLISLIASEKAKGKNGYIRMKMNSMTDKAIIDALVSASKSGVKIDLIIRGICCLQTGLKKQTDNITVRSIVGRYLEHSRIFIFGADPEKRQVFIGSADCMTRNTSRRVEIITPVFDRTSADKLVSMTDLMLEDNVKSSILMPNGDYVSVSELSDDKAKENKVGIDSQLMLYNEAYAANSLRPLPVK